jgi:hypothetical protein
MAIRVLTYDEVLGQLPNTKHLLIGNGFSIACDKTFNYPNLYSYAEQHGLTEHVRAVCQHFGTNNFEGIMRLLEAAQWIAKHYALEPREDAESSLAEDLESIKRALVSAIANTHLPFPKSVDDERKDRCVKFLAPYKNVFTTNYDLLLYWVAMHGSESLQRQDGFRSSPDEPDAEYLVFHEHIKGNKGILFLHGALHIYVFEGEVRKHSWIRSDKRLIELVKRGLERGEYPLFVAEGDSEKKLEQIQHSGYLSYCLGKLERIEQALVIYGMSLGESDQHIINVLADNAELENVYIGVYGGIDSDSGKSIQKVAARVIKRRERNRKRGKYFKPISVQFYDSKTASVWD